MTRRPTAQNGSQIVADSVTVAGQSLTVLDFSGQNTVTALSVSNLPELVSVFGLAGTPLSSLNIDVGVPQLTQLDVSNLPDLQLLATNASNAIESIRIVGTGAAISSTLDGDNGLILASQNLSAEALNQLFTDLPDGQGNILITGNPGAAEADTSIATDKGYAVF